MQLKVLFILFLFVSMTYAGPVAFTTCLKGFGIYTGGMVTSLTTCSATAVLGPGYLACVAAAVGISGAIFFGACVASLLAPTP